MFAFIRMMMGCLLLGCALLWIKKSSSAYKSKKYILSVIIVVLLITVSAFLPFENAMVTFASPEEAYNYYIFGTPDIRLIVNGNNSDLVIGNKNGTDICLIIPKTTDGWKIGIGADTKTVAHLLTDGITISVYQYKKTNDYYITVLDINGESSQITDSCHSSFSSVERTDSAKEKPYIMYCAHISSVSPQYSIHIDGNQIFPFNS